MAVEILQSHDVSETRLRKYLADQIQTSRHSFADSAQKRSKDPAETHLNNTANIWDNRQSVGDMTIGGNSLDFEAFFREQNVLDPAALLAPNALYNGQNLGTMTTLQGVSGRGVSTFNCSPPESQSLQSHPISQSNPVTSTSKLFNTQEQMALQHLDAFLPTRPAP